MRLRDRFGVPVWAPRDGDAVLDEGVPDYRFDDGALLPGGVRALTVRVDGPRADPTGESFLFWETPDPAGSGRGRRRACGAGGPHRSGQDERARAPGGLYAPWSGAVRAAGRNPRSLLEDERRLVVGVVPQPVHLFTGTVLDNLTLFDPGRHK